MTFEETVERILSRCPGLSRESVLERLEEERRRAGGLISDETLLRIVAAGFGCEVLNGEVSLSELLLRDLIPGLNDVSVVGRVLGVFSPRAFSGSRKGRFASLLIADDSGVVRIVLWNEKASLAESEGVKAGDLIRVRHGYTREDYGRRVEVHVGDKSAVEINPVDIKAKGYPSISRFVTRVGELGLVKKNGRVNMVGTVKQSGSVSQFERADSSSGKVMRLVLYDRTGEVSVVVWNEKVDEVEALLKAGGALQVVNAKVKRSADGSEEVHVDGATYVGVQALDFTSLANLKDGMDSVDVAGEVVSRPMVREVKTSKQELLKLATFELKDETARMWVSAWRNLAEAVRDLKVGDRVIIRNSYVKRGFGDQLELSTRASTSIIKEN
jgi:replication factor A1